MNYNRPVRATGKTRSGSVNARKLAMLLAAMAASSQLAPTPVVAQAAATGTVQGRVLNAANGMYLNNARVTVEGTSIETFTNEFGDYTLSDVPAGQATIRTSYTGQEPQLTKIAVEAGKTVSQNISFNASQSTTGEDGTIVLNEFVVASDRFRNAQELATNEERFSTNIKSVVSTDSLGFVPGGNVGEFVKFLPGVQVGYGGDNTVNPANASSISVRGFGPDQTSIMIDGIPITSANPGGLSREAGLDTLSINNASRIEVTKVATPDMPAESSGGSINLITKSAFEYAKPTTNVSLYFTTNTEDTKLSKQQGPTDGKSYHTLPSARVSVAIPFSDKLGVTFSVSSDNQYSPTSSVKSSWQRTPSTFDATDIGGSTSTPVTNAQGKTASLSNPYLGSISAAEYAWTEYKQSGNIKVDWKPIQGLIINSNVNYSAYTGYSTRREIGIQASAPMDWGSDYTIGRLNSFTDYTTTPLPTTTYLSSGNGAKMTMEGFDKVGDSIAGYLKASYSKGPIAIDATASRSVSNLKYEDIKNGHFSTVDLTLRNVGQVRFDGISNGVPAATTITDFAGNTVDHTSLSSWSAAGVTQAGINDNKTRDTKSLYNINLRYQLDFLPFDLAVKTGFRRDETHQERWGKGGTKYQYTGATPLEASQLIDPNGRRSPGYGLPAQEWASVYTLYKLYAENPGLFDPNATVELQAGNLAAELQNAKDVVETNDSYYGMIESKLLNNRLNIIAGARQTKRSRVGKDGAVDTKWNYIKNPDGSLYKDAVYRDGVKIDFSNAVRYDPNDPSAPGVPVASEFDYTEDTDLMARLAAAGALHPGHALKSPAGTQAGSRNNLEATRLAFAGPDGVRTIEADAKDPVAPQIQASYKITDSLTFKSAWSREVALPNLQGRAGLLADKGAFSINEYTGSETQDADKLGVTGQITMSNAGLEPQKTTSWNFELGYYTQNGGKISVSYYYKEIENVWENIIIPSTDPSYAALLETIGLSSVNYPNYRISSTINGARKSKNTGYEIDVRQNLGFLGRYGKNFNMFATYSHKDVKRSTESTSSIQVIAPSADDTYSAGVMFSGSRLSIAARGVYVAENLQRNGSRVLYEGVQVETYDYTPEEYRISVQLDYTISKRYSFFISANNVLNDDRKKQFIDAAYVTPSYASTTSVSTFGVTINTGINAKF